MINQIPEIECLSQEQARLKQLNLFSKHLKWVLSTSKYYQKTLKNYHFTEELDENMIRHLPFTNKAHLSEFNQDFLALPKNKIADFVTTSGTTGDPITFYLSAKDLNRLGYNEAISMYCAETGQDDVFQLITTIDKRFMAGIAYFLGTQQLGAGIVRNGPGSANFQWDSILRFEPTVLIAIPSFVPQLLSYARENGINPNKSSVKKIICIGEPVRNQDFTLNELGKEITKYWNITLYSTYASTEMGAAFTECSQGKGGHLHPDLLYLEVIDEQGNEVESGQAGEVVVTPLGVEGMPLLRYKTGDICHVYKEPCICGRTSWRLGPVMGRKNQMLKYKGTTLFPQIIFNVLDEIREIPIYILEVKKSEFGTDLLTLLLPKELETIALKEHVKSLLKAKIRVVPEIAFLPTKELESLQFPPDSRKPIKLLDKR